MEKRYSRLGLHPAKTRTEINVGIGVIWHLPGHPPKKIKSRLPYFWKFTKIQNLYNSIFVHTLTHKAENLNTWAINLSKPNIHFLHSEPKSNVKTTKNSLRVRRNQWFIIRKSTMTWKSELQRKSDNKRTKKRRVMNVNGEYTQIYTKI